MSQSVLIVGNWRWDIYEEALSNGFKTIGWTVYPFKTLDYIHFNKLSNYLVRARLPILFKKLNHSLLDEVKKTRPDSIFFYRADFILPKTIKNIKHIKPDIVTILFHNDNPFLGIRNKIKYRHFLSSIRFADVTLVYRPSNVKEAINWGAKKVELFIPHYVSYRHKPYNNLQKIYDVVFVGHFEEDGRDVILNYLVERGVKIRIFGTCWEKVKNKYKWMNNMDIYPIYGDEYSKTLSMSKIALVFFSKRHQDVYTRRCFEIPACMTFMISPRNNIMESLFKDGEEIIFYDTKEDLLEKVKFYLKNDELRNKIAFAGYKRCVEGENDEVSRAKQIAKIIEIYKK